jgi:hypothetical protein
MEYECILGFMALRDQTQENGNAYLKEVSVVADIHVADFEVAANDVLDRSNVFLSRCD